MAGLCKGIQRGKGAGLLGLPGFLYGLGFGFAIGAGQALGDVGLQHLGHLQHGCAQLAPLPGGQAQGAGALGGVKVVQIAQVRRHGTLGRSGLCGLAQQRGAPAAHFAQNEQVVVGLVHGQAKLGGGLGALLADPGQGQVLQFGGAGKAQGFGCDGQPQLMGFKGNGGHGQWRCGKPQRPAHSAKRLTGWCIKI